MKFLIALLVFSSLTASAQIYQGQKIQDEDPVWKMTVRLSTSKGSCTGVMISTRAILTAAHCYPGDDTTSLTVAFFKNSEVTEELALPARQLMWKLHPQYNRNSDDRRKYDLMIVKTDSDILPQTHSFARLLPKEPKYGTPTLTVGAGLNGYGAWTGVLSLAKGSVMGFFEPNTVAISSKESAICPGDSGGPTFIRIKDDLFLFAISSNAMVADKELGCGEFLMAVTTVKKNFDWIQKTLSWPL